MLLCKVMILVVVSEHGLTSLNARMFYTKKIMRMWVLWHHTFFFIFLQLEPQSKLQSYHVDGKDTSHFHEGHPPITILMTTQENITHIIKLFQSNFTQCFKKLFLFNFVFLHHTNSYHSIYHFYPKRKLFCRKLTLYVSSWKQYTAKNFWSLQNE